MPQNNKYEIAARRKRVAELYLQGWWQTEIAKELDISQQQVSHDLGVLKRLWQQSSLVDLDKVKSKELAKIDRLEAEYWRAWEKSKKDYQKSTSKQRGKKSGDKIEAETAEKTLQEIVVTGDPRYLQGIQWCVNKRCEIFGLDAARKLDLQSKGESIRPTYIVADSPETKASFENLLNAAQTQSGIQEEQ